MEKRAAAKFKKSESGQLTLSFLFATVLIIGTAGLICALTMALTFSEVIQYVSFSGSRAYFAADTDEKTQSTAAEAQVVNLLRKLPFIAGARSNEWIKVQLKGAKDYIEYARAKGASDNFRNQFIGYQLEVALPLLTFNIPLLPRGLVTPPEGEDVKVTISSFLGREPTQEECEKFNNRVYEAVLSKGYNIPSGIPPESFRAINDNGC